MKFRLVDEDFISSLEGDREAQREWLILEPHPDFPGQWYVNGFDPGYYFDLREVIGSYRVIPPARLEQLLEVADEYGYKLAFFDDPGEVLDAYEALNAPPEIVLNSEMPGTINGMLPFQVQGFNFLKDLDGGVVMWSTGTGKTVLASSLIKYHIERESFDICWFVVKGHNKINTQRALQRLAGIEATVVSGHKDRRKNLYQSIARTDTPTVVITNYEKFRVDHDLILPLVESKRVLCVWDEMPTKLKNRSTKLYHSVSGTFYKVKPPQVSTQKLRPKSLRQYMLSATPIENDPEDWFNCVRLIAPGIYGTVADFRNDYVAGYSFFDPNKPERWHNLDKMGLKAAHITHQVDKNDADIAAQFPEVISEPFYVEWNEKDREIYDFFSKELVKELKHSDEEINILSAIGTMQMLCDMPTMVTDSAERRNQYEGSVQALLDGGGPVTKSGSLAAAKLVEALATKGTRLNNDTHAKLEVLEYLITERHANEKIVIFSVYNDGLLPTLGSYFDKWGVKYVRYGGTDKQRQEAEDQFKSDPDCRVFLSSDAGSDSINLEVASVVINYDMPLKWSTITQRENRIHRITSKFKTVRVYTLLMENSVEDRIKQIVDQKFQYHQGVFKGAIAEQAASARMTASDLYFILGG